jgi:hypothetical protein
MKYGGKFVRGHLLNGDIGGPGDPKNLYPITAEANSHHYQYVEKPIKEWVNDVYAYVHYKVTVDRTPGTSPANDPLDADLVCEAYPLDVHGAQAPGSEPINKRIASRAKGGGGTADTKQTYKAGSALIEPAANVGNIEYQLGKLPVGFLEVEESQLDLLDKIYVDILGNLAYPSHVLQRFTKKFEKRLHLGKDSVDQVRAVMDSGLIPPGVSKSAWNRLARIINNADLNLIYTNLNTKLQAVPTTSRGGRALKPHPRFGDPRFRAY